MRAAGAFGRPGIVRISPVYITTKPAPAERRASRTVILKFFGFPDIQKLAVVLGTEGEGLADKTVADCDYTVKIPMSHGVDSLNVAAASAVAFWQLGR